MNELTSFIVRYNGKFIRAYDETEADKVIAELKMKLAAAQQVLRLNKPEALFSNLETIGRLSHEIDIVSRRERHSNYKRCMAMAKWCVSRAVVWATEGNEKKSDWYWKWNDKWRKLAYKFKEAN